MINLLIFILGSFGLTNILVYGKIFEKIRPKNKLFHCPMCLGWWISLLLFSLTPITKLFIIDYNIVNSFLMASLGSGTSYILCMIVGDEGLRYERTK